MVVSLFLIAFADFIGIRMGMVFNGIYSTRSMLTLNLTPHIQTNSSIKEKK